MKKEILALILFSAVMVLPASAIPVLQLDIDGGTWVGGSEESTITTLNSFSLQALLTPKNSDSVADVNARLARTYYISMAVTPQTGVASGDFGTFLLNGAIVNVTGDMVYGTPPLDEVLEGSPVDNLSPHSIFSTYYYEHGFTFSGTTTSAYNVQDGTAGTGNSYIEAFALDLSGLSSEVELHFDLYTYYLDSHGKKIIADTDFAPYSHDAGTARTSVSVPDGGGTIALFSVALMGLAGLCRIGGATQHCRFIKNR